MKTVYAKNGYEVREAEIKRLDKLIEKHILARNVAIAELATRRALSEKWDRAVGSFDEKTKGEVLEETK